MFPLKKTPKPRQPKRSQRNLSAKLLPPSLPMPLFPLLQPLNNLQAPVPQPLYSNAKSTAAPTKLHKRKRLSPMFAKNINPFSPPATSEHMTSIAALPADRSTWAPKGFLHIKTILAPVAEQPIHPALRIPLRSLPMPIPSLQILLRPLIPALRVLYRPSIRVPGTRSHYLHPLLLTAKPKVSSPRDARDPCYTSALQPYSLLGMPSSES